MNATMLFVTLLAGLFALSYFMKRRFGVLGLALAAGVLISEHWTNVVTPFLQQQGFELVAPSLSVVVAIALTLLPAVILIFGGPSYNKGFERIIGSLLFALLAFAFLIPQIGPELTFDGSSLAMYTLVEDYRPLIIVGGLAVAVIDVFLTRSPHKSRGKKAEH